jgi:hypothetical protein
MLKYKVTKPFGFNETTCPPAWTKLVFPLFNGELVTLNDSELTIEFDAETTVVPNPNVVIEKWNGETETWEPL